jgi:hypothetical protein
MVWGTGSARLEVSACPLVVYISYRNAFFIHELDR